MVDFKQLKQDVSVMDMMEHYGVTLKGTGDEFHGDCILCEASDSLKVNPAKNAWKCFGCNQGGNIIDLAQRKERLGSVKEAAEWIDKHVKRSPVLVPSQSEGEYTYRHVARIVITIGIEY